MHSISARDYNILRSCLNGNEKYRTDLKGTKRKGISPEDIFRAVAVGDIAGMPYEGHGIPKSSDPDTMPVIKDRAVFTDDTVMSAATLMSVREIKKIEKEEGTKCPDIICYQIYKRNYRRLAKEYPDRGYGSSFYDWAVRDIENRKYRSYSNGSAMRSGVIGACFDRQEDVIRHACISAAPSHSHPEGVKGAVVTAMSVWLALHGASKDAILSYALKHYPSGFRDQDGFMHARYSVHGTEWMAPDISIRELIALSPCTSSVTCQISVPEAVACFFHSDSFEGFIRNIFRFSCDSDTVGAIGAPIAAAFYGGIGDAAKGTKNRELHEIMEKGIRVFTERKTPSA